MFKLASVEEIISSIEQQRGNKKVVFTNGCFDILHIGHLRYLQEARAQGDVLVVGLNSDSSVKKLKGDGRPIQNENDRAELLLGMSCVDYVCLFSEETPINLIKSIKPDVLVKGGDWEIEQIIGYEFVLANGGEVKSLSFVGGKSTTNIVEQILGEK